MSTATYTNRLADSTSPYLLQHAHNPVDWSPWGEEALGRARREDKPIFLSIGYASCHWCHVMAHESFEDEDTARLLNQHFIPIKVDREERPDLDELYMMAVQLMGHSGGWPLNLFLTPDLRPFFGGTYFPKEDRWGLSSFRHVLESVSSAYRASRGDIELSASSVLQSLQAAASVGKTDGSVPGLSALQAAAEEWRGTFDKEWGGFGQAPKFPPATAIRVLLRHFHRTQEPEAVSIVTRTLDHMAWGGVYDQVGGGFHRYAVDRQWLTPHFEKMLYDNALLVQAYIEAWQLTRRPRYARIARETLGYLLREMTDPAGGFHSAQDADTEGEEGRFYVWTREELTRVLGRDDAEFFGRFYGATAEGNFEGKNILHVAVPANEFAEEEGLTADELEARLRVMRQKLLEERAKRPIPGVDDKILADWNGLAISAFALGYQAFGQEAYRDAAEKAARFVLGEMWSPEQGLLHAHRAGRSHTPAYLDDYAFMLQGVIDLYEATFDIGWVGWAHRIAGMMIGRFWDAEGGGFFQAPAGQGDLLVRIKRPYDGALPSGNGMAALGLMRLAALTGRADYYDRAEQTLGAFRGPIERLPTSLGSLLLATDFHVGPVEEIAILGTAGSRDTKDLLSAARGSFAPDKVIAWTDPDDAGAGARQEAIPFLEGRAKQDGRATAYVCENRACREPLTVAAALKSLIAQS